MPETLSTPEILLISTYLQLLLYGCNVVLFGVSMVLLQRRKSLQRNTYHKVMTVLLFVLVTLDAVRNTLQSVAAMRIATGGGAINGINLQVCYFFNLVTTFLTVVTTFAILANRCYHIWHQSLKVIALPALMIFTASIIFCALQIPAYAASSSARIGSEEYAQALKRTRLSDIILVLLAMAADGSLTILIASKLWWENRQIKHLGSRRTSHRIYNRIIAIMIESGVIVPAFLIALAIVSLDHNAQAQPILGLMLPQVYALAPLLIMVRVGLGLSFETDDLTTRPHTSAIRQNMEFRANVTLSDQELIHDTGASNMEQPVLSRGDATESREFDTKRYAV